MNQYPNDNTTGGYPPPPQYGQYPPQQPGYPPSGPMPPYPGPQFSQQPMPPGYPPMMPQQPMQPPKKKGKALWFILGIMGVVVLCSALANAGKGNTTPETTTSPANTTNDIGGDATVAPTPTPTPTPVPKTWKTTHTYTGNGNQQTETFAVANDWKIQWKCNPGNSSVGGVYYVSVYNSDATMRDWNVVSADCKPWQDTTGETNQHTGGKVYLDIITGIEWSITVQELK